jgi:hypothetical protein
MFGCDKWLEDALLLFIRNTQPGIGHPDVQIRRSHFRAQRDTAALGKLARIAQKIEQRLPQPHGIGVEPR